MLPSSGARRTDAQIGQRHFLSAPNDRLLRSTSPTRNGLKLGLHSSPGTTTSAAAFVWIAMSCWRTPSNLGLGYKPTMSLVGIQVQIISKCGNKTVQEHLVAGQIPSFQISPVHINDLVFSAVQIL